MERDEVYVPKTRSDLGLPKPGDQKLNYGEALGDTPVYTLYMLVRQQLLAFPAYLRGSFFSHNCISPWYTNLNYPLRPLQSSMYPDRKIILDGPTILIVREPA